MRFLLLCSAALLLLAFVGERASAYPQSPKDLVVLPAVLRPKSDSPPPKSDSPPPKSNSPPPKSDSPPPKSDSPPPKSDTPPPKSDSPPPKSDSPPPKSDTPKGPKSDSPPPKSDSPPPKSDTPKGPKSDSPPPKSDSPPPKSDHLPDHLLESDGPISKKDFLVIVSKSNPTPPPSRQNVIELQKKLEEEQAKTKDFEKQSAILFTAISTAQNEVAKLKRERIGLSAQIKTADRKLLETHVKLIHARQSLEKCQNSSPTALEAESLVEQETKRLLEDKQEPSTDLSHKLKYVRLLGDLRNRIRNEIDQINGKLTGTTKSPTKSPREELFQSSDL